MKLKCKRQNQYYQPENKLLIKVISLLHKIRVTKFPKGISGDVISSKFPTNTSTCIPHQNNAETT